MAIRARERSHGSMPSGRTSSVRTSTARSRRRWTGTGWQSAPIERQPRPLARTTASCTIQAMIPSRTESVRLLLSLDPPNWHLRHSRAVAEIATWLGGAADGSGRQVNRELVDAAALLHDVDK